MRWAIGTRDPAVILRGRDKGKLICACVRCGLSYRLPRHVVDDPDAAPQCACGGEIVVRRQVV
jgi:hypothetical protein